MAASTTIHRVNRQFIQDFIEPAYLIGARFGRLVVKRYIKRGSKRNPNSAVWDCRCECGDRIAASSSELRKGIIRCCEQCAKPKKGSILFIVIRLRNEGLTFRQIEERVGISKSTLQRWLSELKKAA